MAKPSPKPPKGKGPCPKGNGHQWKFPAITNDHIEHECKKCGTKTKRPKGKGSKAVMAAAAILAALIPLSAAKCGGGGQHQGMPVHTRNWWHQAPQYQGGFIVFGQKPPAGQWEQVGWVRLPPGTRLPRVRVWVQK